MEIRQLISFMEIAQCQSFTQAARALGYSQSAITIQIKKLEEELGAPLFDRIGKKTLLTQKGQEFTEYASAILQDVNKAKQSLLTEELTNEVRIGSIESLAFSFLPELLIRLHQMHPKMTVKVILETPEVLVDMMERGNVDLIFILDRPRFSNHWVKVFEQKEKVVFVCNGKNPIAETDSVSLDLLLKQPFVLTEKNASYRYAFDHFLAKHSIELTPCLEISDTEFIVKILEKTDCISLLPAFVVEEAVREKKLAVFNVEGFHTSMYSQLIYHRDKWVTREMKEVIRLLTEMCVSASEGA